VINVAEITLEKIDIIRERTGVSYTEAKAALEATEGNVVDALIYIEKNAKTTKEQVYTSKEEFTEWIKETIRKGNVTRIRVKKDEKVLVDIPINAGLAAGVAIMAALPSLLAIIFLTAVVTRVTVEITKEDGTVDVVNKIIKNAMSNVKDKATEVKDKFTKDEYGNNKTEDNNSYQYTVKFEDENKNNEEDKSDAEDKNDK
jgi:translation elongation factor EF-Ts